MIKRIRIQNFKSISDVTVDLTPVTVLVGRSGTGKSAFVEAIRFLRDYLSGKDVKPVWQKARPAGTNPPPTARFVIDFSVKGLREDFQYAIEFSPTGAGIFEEHLILGGTTLFHQLRSAAAIIWVDEPRLIVPPPPGSLAISRIPSISEIVIAYTALTSGIGCYTFNDQTLSVGNSSPIGTGGLNDAATNYLQVLKELVSNLQELGLRQQIVTALQRVNPTVSAVELDDIREPKEAVVGHRIGEKTLELQLDCESDGFRRVYAYLLAMYQTPPKQTLLFEHPEDGIHPGALAVLAEEFNATPENNRGQVILTTHSPMLLNHFSPEQIRVVELDNFETRIGPISAEQKEAIAEGLLESGELLTVDPARMALESAGT